MNNPMGGHAPQAQRPHETSSTQIAAGRGNALRLNWSTVKGSATREAHLHTYRLSLHPQRLRKTQWRVHLADDWSNDQARGAADTTAEAKHAAEQALARLLGWEQL